MRLPYSGKHNLSENLNSTNVSWRSLSPDELARAYSPSSMVGDIGPFINRYTKASREAKTVLSDQMYENLCYGDAEDESLDLFLPDRTLRTGEFPLAVLVHGGYWQELSKDEHAFPAPAWLSAGYAFATLNYGLAPGSSVARMVTRCRQALNWLTVNAERFGYASGKISTIGHSAGAHLIACAISPDIAGEGDIQLLTSPSRSILIGGIYDLEPICHTYVNQPLGLDPVTAKQLSPQYHAPDPAVELAIIYAEHETGEFVRQSTEYAQRWQTDNWRSQLIRVDERHHFDIMFDIADEKSLLFRKISQVPAEPA